MKRIFLFLITISFAALLLSFSEKDRQQKPKATIRTLIIDPGHGGFDAGAKGSFSNEADVSLEVALKFGKALEKEFSDLKIIYTRTADIGAGGRTSKREDLNYRANLANESAGDLFISIHCNSAPHIRHKQFLSYKKGTVYVGKGKKRKKVTKKIPQYRYWSTPNPAIGTETYIWAVSKNEAKVNSVNKTEFYGEIDSTNDATMLELPDPSDPAEKARMLIYAQQYFRKSYNLAELVEKEFLSTGRVSRGVKQRNDKGIWVLQATGMPSILVEIGFISHAEEERYINSEKGQEEIVESLLNAFKSYKQKLESKNVNTTAKADP
jgi:N-acetylmuramoyl-L-alanine amidase